MLIFLVALASFFTSHSGLAQAQPQLRIVVNAPPVAFPGEKVTIFIETSIYGTPTSDVFIDPHVIHDDNGTIVINVLSRPTSFADGHFVTSFTVPDNGNGTFWIHVPGTAGGVNATGSASFRVLQRSAFSSGEVANSLSNPMYSLLIIAVAVIFVQALLLLRKATTKAKS